MIKNNAFVMIDWDKNGTVKGFYPLNASSVEFLENDKEIFVRFLFLGGQRVVLPYTDIIHLRRFFYKNDMYGETSDAALNPTLELINTTNQGIINAVKSSASLRGLLKFQSMLKPDDMKKQRDSFITDYLDVSNNGGIAATDAKADYVPLTNDPKVIDQKTMEFIDDKVFRYYGVSANIIKSTYSEEEWNAFYESVIEPIAIQLSLQFTSKLFTDREQGFGNQIIFESDRLQYASNKTKISLVETLMDRGLISINEGRSIFNMAPVEGGEKRLISLNYVDSSIQNDYQMGGEKVVTQK
jgi:HK97 family phage portal protein